MSMVLDKDLNVTFDKMAAAVHDIEESSLNVGAYYLKEKVKDSFTSKFPNATKPVRQSKYKNNTVKVHILGAGESGSPLFIARFYEEGTKERFARTYKGQKLKKKRSLGSIKAYRFFLPTVNEQLDETTKRIGQVYENQIDRIFNNG